MTSPLELIRAQLANLGSAGSGVSFTPRSTDLGPYGQPFEQQGGIPGLNQALKTYWSALPNLPAFQQPVANNQVPDVENQTPTDTVGAVQEPDTGPPTGWGSGGGGTGSNSNPDWSSQVNEPTGGSGIYSPNNEVTGLDNTGLGSGNTSVDVGAALGPGKAPTTGLSNNQAGLIGGLLVGGPAAALGGAGLNALANWALSGSGSTASGPGINPNAAPTNLGGSGANADVGGNQGFEPPRGFDPANLGVSPGGPAADDGTTQGIQDVINQTPSSVDEPAPTQSAATTQPTASEPSAVSDDGTTKGIEELIAAAIAAQPSDDGMAPANPQDFGWVDDTPPTTPPQEPVSYDPYALEPANPQDFGWTHDQQEPEPANPQDFGWTPDQQPVSTEDERVQATPRDNSSWLNFDPPNQLSSSIIAPDTWSDNGESFSDAQQYYAHLRAVDQANGRAYDPSSPISPVWWRVLPHDAVSASTPAVPAAAPSVAPPSVAAPVVPSIVAPGTARTDQYRGVGGGGGMRGVNGMAMMARGGRVDAQGNDVRSVLLQHGLHDLVGRIDAHHMTRRVR